MSDEYSLSDVLERLYQNQLALEAGLMELTLLAEKQGLSEESQREGGLVGDWRERWTYQARPSQTESKGGVLDPCRMAVFDHIQPRTWIDLSASAHKEMSSRLDL